MDLTLEDLVRLMSKEMQTNRKKGKIYNSVVVICNSQNDLDARPRSDCSGSKAQAFALKPPWRGEKYIDAGTTEYL